MTTQAVSKIAIVNPYLQGGHIQIAESESSLRFIEAGKNIGIDIRVFANSADVEAFDPDFIVGITYQEGKLTKYPSYVSLNIAPSLIRNVPKFVRNILSYDGFMTVSPSVTSWLNELCAENNKKPYIAHAAFSVPKTEFVNCDFKHARAMYMGTNWDGKRHRNLFKLLEDGEHLKCYGPKDSWSSYADTLYAGEIPFDGQSAYAAYRKNAVGLCVNHPDFDNEGIASSRIFEIAAASALPICADNSLIKTIYGDTVLYLEKTDSTQEMAQQIIEKVEWVRNNHVTAAEMARAAHDKFNEYASMENYIKNLVSMHEQAIDSKSYTASALKNQNNASPKVTYIVAASKMDASDFEILSDLSKQNYTNIDAVVLVKNESDIAKLNLETMDRGNVSFWPVKYDGQATNLRLINQLQQTKTKWIGLLTSGDRIFPNHTDTLLANYNEFFAHSITPIAALKSLYYEYSKIKELPDYMAAQHWVFCNNKMRLGLSNLNASSSLCNLLINGQMLAADFFKYVNFFAASHQDLLFELETLGRIVDITELTNCNDFETNQRQNGFLELKAEVQKLQDALYEKENLINGIYASKSWTLTAPMRKLIAIYRGFKTNRSTPSVVAGE